MKNTAQRNEVDKPTLKRSVCVLGHKTSVSLEAEFWEELQRIAGERGASVNEVIATVDLVRGGNLSSALRLLVLRDLKQKLGNR